MFRDESFNSTVYKGSSAYHQVSWEETKEVRTTTSSIWACLKCCSLIRCAPMGCLDFFTLEFYELTDLGAAFHSRPNLMVNGGASVPWEEWAVFLWEHSREILIQLGWDGHPENILQELLLCTEEWAGVRKAKEREGQAFLAEKAVGLRPKWEELQVD